jgi:hypothetical protein
MARPLDRARMLDLVHMNVLPSCRLMVGLGISSSKGMLGPSFQMFVQKKSISSVDLESGLFAAVCLHCHYRP